MSYCPDCDDETDDGEHHFCGSCGAHLVELSPYDCDDVDAAMLAQHNAACALVARVLENRS
jgi:hypothetical protein